jgi:CHAD domain-containing protein
MPSASLRPRRVAPSASSAELPVNLSEPVMARPSDAPAHHVRAALDLRLRAMLRHDPGTRTGADIEDLHQMRVSVRRMRATLKAARPLLDAGWADDLRAELGWLGGALGPVRDLDVLLLRLRGETADLPADEQAAGEILLAALEEERATARAQMLTALDAPRYRALVERLADAVRLPLPTPSATQEQPALADLVGVEAHKLRRAVRRAGDDPADEVLHALRIRGKRLRYTGELVAPGLRGGRQGKAVAKLLGATAELQEVLGDHQDACVAGVRVRALLAALSGPDVTRAAFVAGRLVEREHERALDRRAAWPAAWAKVDERIAAL